jgi:hypothetical protein
MTENDEFSYTEIIMIWPLSHAACYFATSGRYIPVAAVGDIVFGTEGKS